MDTATLKQILLEETNLYVRTSMNTTCHLTINETEQVYAVIGYAVIKGRRILGINLLARLIEDKIYIDIDDGFPTLQDALIICGVPENQIVLSYIQEDINA